MSEKRERKKRQALRKDPQAARPLVDRGRKRRLRQQQVDREVGKIFTNK
jgi:hypothetical protein